MIPRPAASRFMLHLSRLPRRSPAFEAASFSPDPYLIGNGRRSLAKQVAGDNDAHDLVGAFEDLVHAQIAQIALDREVLEVAVAAVELQRLVRDMKPGIGREALGHRALHRRLG